MSMKRCARGMELDPARAEVEAALGLLDRALRQVEPDERDQPSLRALRVLERAVVRRSERRVAVRLVHAEHEAARDAGRVVDALELLVDADLAVDVVAEVDVRVEDLGVRGQQVAKLVFVPRQQRLRPLELLLHESSVYAEDGRMPRGARRPDLRRHRDLARDAARGADHRSGPVPVRGEGRQEDDGRRPRSRSSGSRPWGSRRTRSRSSATTSCSRKGFPRVDAIALHTTLNACREFGIDGGSRALDLPRRTSPTTCARTGSRSRPTTSSSPIGAG